MCFHRDGNAVVPGCDGGGVGDTHDYDYCVIDFYHWRSFWAARGYEEVKESGYTYYNLIEGPHKDQIAWTFDSPGASSSPTGFLVHELARAGTV